MGWPAAIDQFAWDRPQQLNVYSPTPARAPSEQSDDHTYVELDDNQRQDTEVSNGRRSSYYI